MKKIFFPILIIALVPIFSNAQVVDTLIFEESAKYPTHQLSFIEPDPRFIRGTLLYSIDSEFPVFDVYDYREESIPGASTWLGQVNFGLLDESIETKFVYLTGGGATVFYDDFGEEGIPSFSRFWSYTDENGEKDPRGVKFYLTDLEGRGASNMIGIINSDSYGTVLVEKRFSDIVFARLRNVEEFEISRLSENNEIESGSPMSRIFPSSLTRNNFIKTSPNKFVIFQNDNVVLIDVTNVGKPEIVAQVKLTDEDGVYVALTGGRESGYLFLTDRNRVFILDQNTLELVQTINPPLSGFRMYITMNENISDENAFGKDLLIFSERFFSVDVYKYQFIQNYNEGDPFVFRLVAQATEVEYETTYWGDDRLFDGFNLIQSACFEDGDDYPCGYVIYNIKQEERTTVSNEINSSVPDKFEVYQNYPNPFNPTTNISFDVPQASNVRIEVYDMLGRKVASLVNERKSVGTHTVTFDASNLSSGMYIYRLEAGSFVQTKKLTLIK